MENKTRRSCRNCAYYWAGDCVFRDGVVIHIYNPSHYCEHHKTALEKGRTMTLHEARHALEAANPRDAAIREAIKVVLDYLPSDPEPYRPQAQKRAEAILAAIAQEMDGFNPFKERSRLQRFTMWRYAIWHQLRLEGYSCVQIGRATGYDHSTVYWGDRRITDWISVHDFDTMRVWRTLQEIISKPEPKFYGD